MKTYLQTQSGLVEFTLNSQFESPVRSLYIVTDEDQGSELVLTLVYSDGTSETINHPFIHAYNDKYYYSCTYKLISSISSGTPTPIPQSQPGDVGEPGDYVCVQASPEDIVPPLLTISWDTSGILSLYESTSLASKVQVQFRYLDYDTEFTSYGIKDLNTECSMEGIFEPMAVEIRICLTDDDGGRLNYQGLVTDADHEILWFYSTPTIILDDSEVTSECTSSFCDDLQATPNLSDCSVLDGAKVTSNLSHIAPNSTFVIYGFTSDEQANQWVTALNTPHATRSGYLQDLKLNDEVLRVPATHPWVYKKGSSSYSGHYNRIQIDASGSSGATREYVWIGINDGHSHSNGSSLELNDCNQPPTPTPNLLNCSVIDGAKVISNGPHIAVNSTFVIYGFAGDEQANQWVTALNTPHATRSGYLQDLKLNDEVLRVPATHPWVYKKGSSSYSGHYNRIQIDASGSSGATREYVWIGINDGHQHSNGSSLELSDCYQPPTPSPTPSPEKTPTPTPIPQQAPPVSFVPATKADLQTAVNEWIADESSALTTYGDINTWDTSNITNMSDLFSMKSSFNSNISNWDVSNVTAMERMFFKATSFNQPIGNWNTSNVRFMTSLFGYAEKFNQDISSWDTSNVEFMNAMFMLCTDFNQNISNWNTANVTTMKSLFYEAVNFNQPIGDWNTSNVTNMSYMFAYATLFNQDISNWNTSKVTDMGSMFYSCDDFNSDIGSWDTSNVTNMNGVFNGAISFDQDISNWNTSKVTNMTGLFGSSWAFNKNIGAWDTSKVTNMTGMFSRAHSFNQPIGNWNTSNVTNMRSMFYDAFDFNQNLNAWDTSKVTDMSSMFTRTWQGDDLPSFNSDISSWNTSNVTNMKDMFRSCKSFNQDISAWDTSKVTNMKQMFDGALTFNSDISLWNVSSVTNMDSMFWYAPAFDQDLTTWCVDYFDSEPTQFGGTTSWTSRPVWGTCPDVLQNQSVDPTPTPTPTPTPIPAPVPTFSLSATSSDGFDNSGTPLVIEGNSVTITLTTTNVPEGTLVAWGTNHTSYLSISGGDFPAIGADGKSSMVISTVERPGENPFDTGNTSILLIFSTFGFDEIMATSPMVNFKIIQRVYTPTPTPTPTPVGMVEWISAFPTRWNSTEGNTILIQNINNWVMWPDMANPGEIFIDVNPFHMTDVDFLEFDPNSNNGCIKTSPAFDYENPVDDDGDNILHFTLIAKYTVSGKGFTTAQKQMEIEVFNSTSDDYTPTPTPIPGPTIFTPTVKAELKNIADLWVVNQEAALQSGFGDINTWDVSNITDMSDLFEGAEISSLDISNWDVSNVTNMESMFEGAEMSSLNLSNWNTGNVTNMKKMFAVMFNLESLDVSNFNTSSVLNMEKMFYFHGNQVLNKIDGLLSFDTSQVTNMKQMFGYAEKITDLTEISGWSYENVQNMDYMLDYTQSLSTESYDAILNGWAGNQVNPSVPTQSKQRTGAKYSSASQDARDFLTQSFYGWTITDGGMELLKFYHHVADGSGYTYPYTDTQLRWVLGKSVSYSTQHPVTGLRSEMVLQDGNGGYIPSVYSDVTLASVNDHSTDYTYWKVKELDGGDYAIVKEDNLLSTTLSADGDNIWRVNIVFSRSGYETRTFPLWIIIV